MKKSKYPQELLEELGRRLAIAEASVFTRVTYRTAERTIDAVHGSRRKPGDFWLQLAEIALDCRYESMNDMFHLDRNVNDIQSPRKN
ncbi:MAG: hypothetical protein LAN84_08685 [Acidobacteriia bacterium]|nr:hypothetical protein [Terriglobia bacterium]